MTTNAFPHSPSIPPKDYFDAAPTWYAWNKVTAADVHALRFEPAYYGQNIYFHLNHPIRFVRLVGLVLDIQVLYVKNQDQSQLPKYVLICLDDGSGSTIEVKTTFRSSKGLEPAGNLSNTVVDNLDVPIRMGIPTLYIDNKVVDIGDAIQVKGSLDKYREMQIQAKRVKLVTDTNEEAASWAETAQWKREKLSKPWILTKEQRMEIDEQIQRRMLRDKQKQEWKCEQEGKNSEKSRAREERHEKRRKKDEARLDHGALRGSSTLPD